jgi:hypothetical protein
MTPPRLPRWLLGRVVPPGPEGDTIRGDLLEDFSTRAERSRAAASLGYWRAVLSILFRYRRPGRTRGSVPRQQLREALVQDVRYAFCTLVMAPAFAAVVLVTLAVGLSDSTALWHMAYASAPEIGIRLALGARPGVW